MPFGYVIALNEIDGFAAFIFMKNNTIPRKTERIVFYIYK